MNSVNQMVSDLKDRMNDGSKESPVKKNQKKNIKAFPWTIVLLVLLSVAVGAVTTINYFNILGDNKSITQIKRQNIMRDPVTSVVINMVPDDKKVSVVGEITPETNVLDEKQVVPSETDSAEHNKKIENTAVKKEVVLAKKQIQKPEEQKPVAKEKVESPKVTIPSKTENGSTKAKVVKEKPVSKKTKKSPAKIAKAEKKTVVVKAEKPVKKEKIVAVAKMDEPKARLTSKPKIPEKVKPKVPPKKDVIKTAEEAVVKQNAFTKIPIPLSNSELAETIYQRGMTLLEQGEIERASALFVKTLKEYPPHVKATEALVGIYSNQQDWVKAVETLKSGIGADRKNVSLTMWLAQIYLQQEKMPAALELLKTNEKYARGNGEYFALLAVIYQNLEQYELALTSYQKALKVDNASSRWWFGMAVVLELQNNLSDAQVAYTQAINTEQLPDDLVTYAEQRLEYIRSQN